MNTHPEQFVTALTGAPFGLKGHIKARPLSGEIEHLFKLDSALLRQERGGKITEKRYEIEETLSIPPHAAIKFRGIDSPEAAKALTNAEIIINRKEAAPLEPGEFYVEDLKGMEVAAAWEGEGGVVLGSITGFVEGGGGDLAEIRLNDGSLRLVPFRNEFFGDVDGEKGRISLLVPWILE
ncbi:ribosome maturation factor RimM [Spirochaetia bacterium]|nr:ribosome maturation factor RimM [Spirochaetia bacterium]